MNQIAHMTAIVHQVALTLGYAGPLKVLPMSLEDTLEHGPDGLFVSLGQHAIKFGPWVTRQPKFEIEGRVAHEIGHLDHGLFSGLSQREEEDYADEYAVKHGYGPNFLASLETNFPISGCTDSCPHGDPLKRINRVKQLIQKYQNRHA